ncbi:MAG: tyrosine--tRNA ligase [Candidatus Hydrogenedentes bacterium]|nr:tyrosine--tRNA ligase [Candidatus Hydrogenedentota bacterium]
MSTGTLFDTLTWRGFVNQYTDPALPELLEREKPFTLYCGFDPTADSLHIGSLLPILGLAHFQRAGHRPIALVGGGTGLIGDPSFKAQERAMLSREQVEHNAKGIRRQLERFLDFEGSRAALLLNNAEWLCALPLIDFLRDVGKCFTVNVMLSRESVRQRIEDREHGMSFTEFSYSLLQAYDFYHLNEHHGCRLQIGGSDQWGNIVSGIDLIRRKTGRETYGLTFPLVTKADGSKFGKTESGNVWLDPTKTSPYRFYQFWINQADADVGRYLRYFTFLEREEIEALEQAHAEAPHLRQAQKKLAEEVTRMVHGGDALEGALRATAALFGGDLRGLDEATLLEVFEEAPSATIPRDRFGAGTLVDALTDAGVFASKGEARRLIRNGGIYLNGQRIEREDAPWTSECLLTPSLAVLRVGKKNYHLLRVV